jgi:hypothetical protein
MQRFKSGDAIVFDHTLFNKGFFDRIPPRELAYYKTLGYDSDKPKVFVFLCEISGSDHAVILSLDDNEIFSMVHWDQFRLAKEEEF